MHVHDIAYWGCVYGWVNSIECHSYMMVLWNVSDFKLTIADHLRYNSSSPIRDGQISLSFSFLWSVAIFMTANNYNCSVPFIYILMNIRCHLFCHPLHSYPVSIIIIFFCKNKARDNWTHMRLFFNWKWIFFPMISEKLIYINQMTTNFVKRISQFSCIFPCLKVRHSVRRIWHVLFYCSK